MSSEQICNLLLETAENQGPFKTIGNHQSILSDHLNLQDEDIKSRLYQILHSLQEEKNQFISIQHKQKQLLVEKVNVQKDQIIEDLLKSIYNLKKQNQQLKFQYRKRFKVIKNMQEKYQNLILGKNKKITELQSVVKYLEGKLKYLQKKLYKFQAHAKKEMLNKNQLVFSKSPQNYYSPNKINVIVSKEKRKLDLKKKISPRNSLEDVTMPLKQSFISLSKVTSSSKTITRNKSKQNHKENLFSNHNQDQKQSDLYSSFLASTENNGNEIYMDNETNFEDSSRIKPVCFESFPYSTTKYLTLQDFNDLQKNQFRNTERSMRKSQQVNSPQGRRRQNIFRENY